MPTFLDQLKHAILEKLSSDPTGATGRIYYNTSSNVAKLYTGSAFSNLVMPVRYAQRSVITNPSNRPFAGNSTGATADDLVCTRFGSVDTTKKHLLVWAFDVENKTANGIQIDVSLKVGASQAAALANTPSVRLQSLTTTAISGSVWGLAGGYLFTPTANTLAIVLNSSNNVQVNPNTSSYNSVALIELDANLTATTAWD